MARTLVLFTASFPFQSVTEEVFVTPEIEALAKEFDKIITVPLERPGKEKKLSLGNVETDTFIADHLFTTFKLSKTPYLLHPAVLTHYKHLAKESRSVKEFLSGVFFCMNAVCFGKLIKRWIDKRGLKPEETLFYTFWFDHITSALALIAAKHGLRIATRAHGHDVYDSQILFRSHKFRAFTLSRIDKVFAASGNAAQYMRTHYPEYAEKIQCRILGSVKPDEAVLTKAHTPDDGEWTLLSCARVSIEKRIDRNFHFAKALAATYPFKQIKWIHVGDGPKMKDLKEEIKRTELPVNLVIDLRGEQPNSEVARIYESEPIDWTLLFSDSEGGCPIALCESLSYGVPAVATDVGGIPEIITPDVGITVAPDTAPEGVVGEMQPYLNEPRYYLDLKSASLKRWQELFSAKKLRAGFAVELSTLLRP